MMTLSCNNPQCKPSDDHKAKNPFSTGIISTGIVMGAQACSNCGHEMAISEGHSNSFLMQNSGEIAMGAKISVGGRVKNIGKIHVGKNGELDIKKDLLNAGDIKIQDSEKLKELFIECVKTSGNVADLGNTILKKFFGQ